MSIQLMDIRRQHEEHAAEYEEAAIKVLRSGAYIGGSEVSAFENEFAEYMEVNYAVSCGNGTDALVLALRALGIGAGDEVITVAFTFFATAESIAAVGARPVFIDIDPDTYCMNPDLIEGAITERTKAILPVHIYGNPADMGRIQSIARKHHLYVIADCAQCAGSRLEGRRKTILGDVACFSFFPTKNLGCDGDGGMVVTDDERIATACRSLKVHGSGENGLKTLQYICGTQGKTLPENMPLGTSKYYNYLIGYNTRLDAVQAAILRVKLKYLDEFVEKRRANAEKYNKALMDTSYILPSEAKTGTHSYYLYVLRHKESEKILDTLKDNGIGCGRYYPVPLHLQGAFWKLGYKEGSLPITERICKESFAIPVFPELFPEEQDFIIQILKQF